MGGGDARSNATSRRLKIAHSAVTTAVVFVVLQVVAFTYVFNKTYVTALTKTLRVPAQAVAYHVARNPDTNDDVKKRLLDVCGPHGVTKENIVQGAKAYISKEIPRTDEAITPDPYGTVLLGVVPFAAIATMYHLRKTITAQALFNGALICGMFTAGEVVAWLLLNTPNIQVKINGSLRKGAHFFLRRHAELCPFFAAVSFASDGWNGAYNKARRNEGIVADLRASLWVPATGIIFGCAAAAYILRSERSVRFRAGAAEIALTVLLVLGMQYLFLQYSTSYKFYGSKPDDMADIAERAICKAVGGAGQLPYAAMPPTLSEAILASDDDIKNTAALRNLGLAYFGAWALLFALRLNHPLFDGERVSDRWLRVFAGTGTDAIVAAAGWVTEAYFYQFVVAQTQFVAWNAVEDELFKQASSACFQQEQNLFSQQLMRDADRSRLEEKANLYMSTSGS